MLELMHFPEELLDVSEFKQPVEKAVGKAEMQMAKQLIQSMTSEWNPEQYTDEYHEALEKMIEEKIEHGDEELPVPAKKKKPTNVVDLVSVLQQSIQQTQAKPKSENSTRKTRALAPEEGRIVPSIGPEMNAAKSRDITGRFCCFCSKEELGALGFLCLKRAAGPGAPL